MSVLNMTLKIWLWGFNFEALENVEYHFIAIIPKSTLKQSGSICEKCIIIFYTWNHLYGSKQMINIKLIY